MHYRFLQGHWWTKQPLLFESKHLKSRLLRKLQANCKVLLTKEKLLANLPVDYPNESYPGLTAPFAMQSHQSQRVACGLTCVEKLGKE